MSKEDNDWTDLANNWGNFDDEMKHADPKDHDKLGHDVDNLKHDLSNGSSPQDMAHDLSNMGHDIDKADGGVTNLGDKADQLTGQTPKSNDDSDKGHSQGYGLDNWGLNNGSEGSDGHDQNYDPSDPANDPLRQQQDLDNAGKKLGQQVMDPHSLLHNPKFDNAASNDLKNLSDDANKMDRGLKDGDHHSPALDNWGDFGDDAKKAAKDLDHGLKGNKGRDGLPKGFSNHGLGGAMNDLTHNASPEKLANDFANNFGDTLGDQEKQARPDYMGQHPSKLAKQLANDDGEKDSIGKHIKDGAKRIGDHLKNAVPSLFDFGARAFRGTVSGIMNGASHLGMKMSAATAKKLATTSMIVPLLLGGGAMYYLFGGDDNQYVDNGSICGMLNKITKDISSMDGGSATAGGDWTKPNTTAYKTAKGIFNAWVHQGCSGAAAAGIVGYITGEGGSFNVPDQAELPFSGDKSGQISKGSVPNKADHGGGGGVYQLTPFDEYAPVGSKKWLSVSGQTKFFISKKKIKGSGWNSTYDFSGKAPTFRAFAHLDNPVDACKAWDAAEIGNPGGMDQRIANAKKAYKMFNGANIKANDSLIGNGAGTAGAGSSADHDAMSGLLAKCKNKGNGNGGPVTSGNWGAPFPGFSKSSVSSGFGAQPGRNWHDGIDIGTSNHTGAIRAIHGGKVMDIKCIGHDQSSLGYYVAVQSPDGYSEIYQEFAFSMSDGNAVTKVRKGDTVHTGQVICKLTPSTPMCTHIHIGIYHGSVKKMLSVGEANYSKPGYGWVDPMKMIKH